MFKNKEVQDFVYLKADEGENWVDPMYQANVAAAKSAGLAYLSCFPQLLPIYECVERTMVTTTKTRIPIMRIHPPGLAKLKVYPIPVRFSTNVEGSDGL